MVYNTGSIVWAELFTTTLPPISIIKPNLNLQCDCIWRLSFQEVIQGFSGGSVVKNLPANARASGDMSSIPGVGRISWRRKWQPNPVFLPEQSRELRSLAGYRRWGCKESDTTEHASTHKLNEIMNVWHNLIGLVAL